jgi:DNA-binding NtrC family response regulator
MRTGKVDSKKEELPVGTQVFDSQKILSDPLTGKLDETDEKPDTHPEDQNAAALLIGQLALTLLKAPDKKSLAEATLALLCQRLAATRALLAEIESGQRMSIMASHGFPEQADLTELVSKTVMRKITEELQVVLIGDTTKDDKYAGQDSIRRNRIRAVACAPIVDGDDRLRALVYLDSQDRPAEFSAQDARFLVWIGHFFRLLWDNLEMQARLGAEITTLKRMAAGSASMIAEAPATIRLLERAKKAAASDAAILILGDTGAGKECIARFIHKQSRRAEKPFVVRNCAAIPETLFESEMFGHVKGAFTGAHSDHKGAFQEAAGGTLFLDEIGDLDYGAQTKLLRAIQEKAIRPVGGDKDIKIDARIISATNKNLGEALKIKQFREDLYYRISTVTVSVPALRDRREDIVPLARHFVRQFSDGTRTLSPEAEASLLAYAWPGNVRELRGKIEEAVIFAGSSEIQPAELNIQKEQRTHIDVGSQLLADAERRHILGVLRNLGGNKTEAAKVLGIARSTLVLKLKEYGL